MNKRLQEILSLIPQGRGLIDVGTDHGYLPTELAKSGYTGHILASDIRPGPLSAARRTAEEAGLSDRIRFLLCDGLDQCPPELIDTVVIAGMGGDTICGIVDRAEWTMDPQYTLLLQPMTKAEVLRYWLSNNEYEICREELVLDGGRLYQILLVRYGASQKLSDAELFTGQYTQVHDHPLFPALLDSCIKRFERQLDGMEKGRDGAESGRYALLQHILLELKEMKARADS